MSLINVDLPDPETPVIDIKYPNGNSTSIFFRLFSCAPLTIIFPFCSLIFSSILINYDLLDNLLLLICDY